MALTRRKQLHVEGSGPYTLHQTDVGGAEMPEHLHVGTTAPAAPYDGQLWLYQGGSSDGTELYSYDGTRSKWLSTRDVVVTFSVPEFEASTWRGYLWLATNPADGQTITIGADTWTFKTTLTPTAGEVLIGTDPEDTLRHLAWSINGTTWAIGGADEADFYVALASQPTEYHAIPYHDNATAGIDSQAIMKIVDRTGATSGAALGGTAITGSNKWVNVPDETTGAATAISAMVRNQNSLAPGEFFAVDGGTNSYVDYGWFAGISSDSSSDDVYTCVGWSYYAPSYTAGPTGAAVGLQIIHDGDIIQSLSIGNGSGNDLRKKHRNVLNEDLATGGSLAARVNPAATSHCPPGTVFKLNLRKKIT